MRVWLIGCAKSKRTQPCAADQMYEPSALFRLCVAYARQEMHADDSWFICSAKLGLLVPTTVIAPYEHRLRPRDAPAWGKAVAARLGALDATSFVSLLGADYERAIFAALPGVRVERPLAGLSMGKRLRYLRDRVR